MARLAFCYTFIFNINAILLNAFFPTQASEQCFVSGCTNYWNFDKNYVDQKNPSIKLYNQHNYEWVPNRKEEKESALCSVLSTQLTQQTQQNAT